MTRYARMPSPIVFAIIVVSLCLLATTRAKAFVRLPKIFTSNMVLQQEMPIRVWGWAEPGEEVSVTLAGDKPAAVTADKLGHWSVELPPMKADGKTYKLVVKGKNRLELDGILIGEVWLCAGQSNMNRSTQVKENDPNIRLFWISGSNTPMKDDLGDKVLGWTPATATAVAALAEVGKKRLHARWRPGFTEVGYVFGRQIHKELKVPVGLIMCAYGGSQVQSWTPHEGVEKKYPFGVEAKEAWLAHRPGFLYRTMVHGMVPLSIRGVVWYQGENDGRAGPYAYAKDMDKWIASWRKLWGREDMPFYFAQIAQTGYASGMLRVWESQAWVAENIPHTGLATSNDLQDKSLRTDEGNPNAKPPILGTGFPLAGGSNPHPPNKHIVAKRLADMALAKTYGKIDREVLPPIYDSLEVKGDRILVKFKNTGSGLKTDDGKPVNWFEISDGVKKGEGRAAKPEYVPAEAKIVSKDTVELTSPKVKSPKLVRFAWHVYARHNLYNKEGLPAISFRTDGPQGPKKQ